MSDSRLCEAPYRQPAAFAPSGPMTVSLALRQPFHAQSLLAFLRQRVVAGLEACDANAYARTLRLPHGHGRIALTPRTDRVECELDLTDARDLSIAVEGSRHLFDLDADPGVIDEHLRSDPLLRPRVAKCPGIRVPGHIDGFEAAVRAIVGQQISVAGARTIVSGLVMEFGDRIDTGGALTHLFPTPDAMAAANPGSLPMPSARGRALVGLAAAVAEGSVVLDRSADRGDVRDALLALPGIGPWTAGYIALRALGDPDVFLATDLGVRKGLARLEHTSPEPGARTRPDAWRPWRSYSLMHVWTVASEEDAA
ncbi:MAG: DNA-3-methyladenine glycosylase 2 family protein [Propionibacteriales bacterium]|nr:DNA-3-methyladenine glycosylase 2 family protein [Propionibacteriales bacterium]